MPDRAAGEEGLETKDLEEAKERGKEEATGNKGRNVAFSFGHALLSRRGKPSVRKASAGQ
jgi:hypothetical protein